MQAIRKISSYDAAQCELGRKKACHCRCNGELHGKSHAKLIAFENKVVDSGKTLTKTMVDGFIKKN